MKQINAVQDESAKKLPPHHSLGMGLRKSPPELNAAEQRLSHVKAVESVSHTSEYSGHNSTQLRTMNDVESNCLEEDHTFVTKDILNLHIAEAEEANLRCIKMKVERTDNTNFIIVGINFYVSGTFSENSG